MSLLMVRGAYVPSWAVCCNQSKVLSAPQNANKINGIPIENTEVADGEILKYDAETGTLMWGADGGNGGGGRPTLTSTVISSANNEETLTSDYDIYYVAITMYGGFNVHLPDPAEMTNRQIVFILTGSHEEANFVLYPFDSETINNGGSFSLGYSGNTQSVTMLCDGTDWWVTARYN